MNYTKFSKEVTKWLKANGLPCYGTAYDSPEVTQTRLDAWMQGSKMIAQKWISEKRYQELISCAHVEHPKPAPDSFLLALKELGVSPQETVVVEDSCFGSQAAKAAGIRGEVTEIGWGNQIRSYVMQPYTMVKDHRTNEETGNVDAVLDGGIDIFINAYLKWIALKK